MSKHVKIEGVGINTKAGILKTKRVAFDRNNSPIITLIRTKVFVEEQGVDAAIDFDGRDESENAIHVLVFFQDEAIGTARMLDDGHIGRVAVLKNQRGKGAGYLAVTTLISEAKNRGYKRVYLGSQVHASDFYKKMNFKICGEEFMEAGIKHIEMEYFL